MKSEKPVVGVLGGGQLALMLCDMAEDLAIRTSVYATKANDPAISHANEYRVGSFQDADELVEFVNSCDVVTYENEFIPEPILLAVQEAVRTPLVPDASVMTRCANKLAQKKLFESLNLPTASYISATHDTEPSAFISHCRTQHQNGCVVKWAKGGYDGGGVFVFRGEDQTQEALAFVKKAFEVGSDVYAEELVNFDNEVALVGMRSQSGEFLAYPLVETIQENGICTNVVGPAFPALQNKAKSRAKAVADELGFVGVFAIEYFVCGTEILINEMAPRVHNSGHVTMNGASTSQFENHLRAVLGKPFGKINHTPKYGMVNILGPDSYIGPLAPPQSDIPETAVHWYEKEESRPGRKIGHLNCWANEDSISDFDERMVKCNELVKVWRNKMGGKS